MATSGTSTYRSVGRDTRENPRHLDGVSEGDDHLIDEAIFADGARDGGHLEVRWHARNRVRSIERSQCSFAFAAGHHGNVVDVGVVHHGGEDCFYVGSGKLILRMLVPELLQIVVFYATILL